MSAPEIAPVVAPLPHPARFSPEVLPVMARFLPLGALVLDPFGGTGERGSEIKHVRWVRVELEEGWADCIQGNALELPFPKHTFDAICTSPVYGNRMSDSHNAKDKSKRITYTHTMQRKAPGRRLRKQNAGTIQWGAHYRVFHLDAWRESRRVLKPGGRLILNISDHIRSGTRQEVTGWHITTLTSLGFSMVVHQQIETRRMGMGANGGVRMDYESVLLFAL